MGVAFIAARGFVVSFLLWVACGRVGLASFCSGGALFVLASPLKYIYTFRYAQVLSGHLVYQLEEDLP